MKWLKYAGYVGYLSYVYSIMEALTEYRTHKSAAMLAAKIANVVYDAVDFATKGKAGKRVERANVTAAVKSVTDLYIDIL